MIIMESAASKVLLQHTEQSVCRKVRPAVRQSKPTTAHVAQIVVSAMSNCEPLSPDRLLFEPLKEHEAGRWLHHNC